MAKLIKCKICGDTEFTEVGDLLQCRSCKHKTPKPKDNAELLERANNLRFETKSFDDAAALYEEIIRLTPDEAEAYWGRVLCRYGIEYVKDSDGKYLPTCHRTIEGSILDDGDYKMAVMKAEQGMSEYYMSEAKTIDEYQKKIKLIAAKEEPYDVFISFKATDDAGKPTEDSLLAQELYYYLTKNLGLKVFFSNITLKDKAGQEYEPIIYAALSSSTVMVLVGTKPEYINATWVKNEWSRYIKMVSAAKAQNKSKYIVTALKGMKPEQLPTALAAYQAINLGELGAKEKLCSNIDGLIGDLRVKSRKDSVGASLDANDVLSAEANNLCNLGFQQLSIGDFDNANEYFQKALEKKSDTALAHWGKLLVSEEVQSDEGLYDKVIPIKEYSLYKLAMENASAEEKMRFETAARRCQEAYDRADAKTRHNNEYLTRVEELKYNYAKNKSGERIRFDEKADGLYDDYFAVRDKHSSVNEEHDRLYLKRSGGFIPVFVMIIAGLFLLLSTCSSNVIKKADEVFEPYVGGSISQIIRDSDVPMTDILNNEIDYTELGLTKKQVKKIEKADVSVSDQITKAVAKDSIITFAVVFLFCATIMILLLKLILSTKAAVIITLLFGGTVSAFATLGMFMLSLNKPNIPFIVSYSLLGIGALFLILKIIKKITTRASMKSIESQQKQCEQEEQELRYKIARRSIEQIDELNAEYSEQFGDEIDKYEDNGIIVKESLGDYWQPPQ